jgi:GNAT superfamily N-acetyltransferase
MRKTMATVKIGPAVERDLRTITSLIADLSVETDGPDSTNRAVIERNVRTLFRDPRAHFLVARKAGRVVGFVNFAARKTITDSSRSALIDELAVSRKYRGQGIGRMLISAVVAWCRKVRCCELEVSTLARNQRARRFYKECGFDEEAVLLEMPLGA